MRFAIFATFLISFFFLLIMIEAVQNECVCRRDYKPVCGNDDRTYPNECVLKCIQTTENSGLRMVKEGECSTKFE